MRVIAIEEHFATHQLLRAQRASQPAAIVEKLLDVGEARLAGMDEAGIDVQVLSSSQPGVQIFEARESLDLAKQLNDRLAAIVAQRPERFAGFATIATPDPRGAARELERCVRELGMKGGIIHGHTNGRFLDDQEFWPIFEAAQGLAVPIYLHPTRPTEAVYNAYFSGLGDEVGRVLSTNAWGWHVETGMHALRIVLGGVFDRFPHLQMIIGHMGENIPFSLARADQALAPVTAHLERRVGEYFLQNFYITTSGYFTQAPLVCALMVFGADRIIFSVDYPFGDNRVARQFLDDADLSDSDRAKIAHGNVEALLGLAPAS